MGMRVTVAACALALILGAWAGQGVRADDGAENGNRAADGAAPGALDEGESGFEDLQLPSIENYVAAPESREFGGGDEAIAGLPDPGLVRFLERRAHELARSELERFNEIEKQYQNIVEFHEIPDIGGMLFVGGGVYLKSYRDFKGYTIDDITLTDSLRYPVQFEITFGYDLMGTPPRHSGLGQSLPDLDPEVVAERDERFDVLRELEITRIYRVDSRGVYHGGLDELPPRDNFYEPAGRPPYRTAHLFDDDLDGPLPLPAQVQDVVDTDAGAPEVTETGDSLGAAPLAPGEDVAPPQGEPAPEAPAAPALPQIPFGDIEVDTEEMLEVEVHSPGQ